MKWFHHFREMKSEKFSPFTLFEKWKWKSNDSKSRSRSEFSKKISRILENRDSRWSLWWWWGWQQHHHYDSRWKSSTHQTQLDEGSLKLIETETGETLNCQVCRLITRTTPPIRQIIPKLLKYYFKINIQNKYYFKKSCLNITLK